MNTEETTQIKKRMMFAKGDDFYFIAYNVLLLLLDLGCDSSDKVFKDYRKLSYLVDFISNPLLIGIVAEGKEAGVARSSIDGHELSLAYSRGASRQHLVMRLLCALERKGLVGIERGTQQEGFDVFLRKNQLPSGFLDDQLYESERANIRTLRQLFPQLRIVKLKTLLQQLFAANGVEVWHA
jgi:hypothetical protein